MNIDYYYSIDGAAQRGPVSKDQLRAMGLSPRALVWREGLPAWVEAQSVPELADLFFAPQVDPVAQPSSSPQTPSYPQAPATQGLQPLQASLGPANAPLNYQGYQTGYANPVGTNGLAVTSMILGIVAVPIICIWWLSGILAIMAIIFGHVARSQIAVTRQEGAGMAMAGLILGYIVVGLMATILLIGAIVIGIAATH